MSYSRQGRPRRPSIVSLHERMPKSRWLSDMTRRARLAGMNGPAYTLPSRSTRLATSTRGHDSAAVSFRYG